MIKKVLFGVLFFTCIANATFKEVDYKELIKMKKQNIVVIDIRRLDEFKKYGIIKGANTLTFFNNKGAYNVSVWMNKFVKLVKTKEQVFVLYCAHANRTKVVGNFLSKKLGYKNVYDLKGGIDNGWIKKGMNTVEFK
jgi:rhodanese-related sulfurtransferase